VVLAQDKNGNMWVGTNGGGLARTIGKDSEGVWLFENYGAKDGLPSEEIRSLTFDNRGNAWFATDHILCSFDIGKKIFTTFSSLDGVDETMCSEGAAITMPNGNVLFGTLVGYYLVDRAKLVTSAGNIIKLRITDFWLNEELQSPRLNDNYDYYVPDSRSVELPGHSELIAFRFASLNFQLQHRIHYQYMLEGYDYEWKNADRTRTATYSNLPTGTYRFKVKAFLLEAPEKFDQKIITVIVPPFFLLSSNAIWIYMLIGAALGIWLMFRLQKWEDKKEKVRLLREGPRKQKNNQQEEQDNYFMKTVNDFLEMHYSDPMLTIDELVTETGVDSATFNKQFKEITGQTPKEYIIDFRLKNAIRKLETTADTIAQIAFDCGFSSAVSFNHTFSQKTGVTPSKYRDEHKAEKADKAGNADTAQQEKEPAEKHTDEYEIIED
jgi:AraC-like DNA-binding protein